MDKFWLYDLMILFNSERIMEILPKSDHSLSRRLNAITRCIILLTILGYFYTRNINMLISMIICLMIIVIFYKHKYQKDLNENIHKKVLQEGFDTKEPEFKKILDKSFTQPTKDNPLMNVLVNEIQENPNKKAAAPSYNETISNEIDKVSKSQCQDSKLYNNLGDNLTHQNMMRNFHSMPNTRVYNDQKSFREFCYGTMKSCKEEDADQCSKDFRKVGPHFY